MIEFTEEEREMINKYKDSNSKASMMELYKIYDSYMGTKHDGCWCGSLHREEMRVDFNNWANENGFGDGE